MENSEEGLTCWKEDKGGNNVDGKQEEQQLLENRIKMDRKGAVKTGRRLEIVRNKKRGAYVVGGEDTGRLSKKRKYVMVGEDWGTKIGNKDQGRELLIED